MPSGHEGNHLFVVLNDRESSRLWVAGARGPGEPEYDPARHPVRPDMRDAEGHEAFAPRCLSIDREVGIRSTNALSLRLAGKIREGVARVVWRTNPATSSFTQCGLTRF